MPLLYPLTIQQGASFTRTFRYRNQDGTPIDISGYSARLAIKRNYKDQAPLKVIQGPGATVDGPNGVITFHMTGVESRVVTPGPGFYDVDLIAGDEVVRLLSGSVIVLPGVITA